MGKDYLRTQASLTLGGDVWALQLFYNLLPEFGSLPWTMKPVIMFLVDRYLRHRQRHLLAGLAALTTGMVWACLAAWELSAFGLLMGTMLMSLGSAVVDGLVDGQVAEESLDCDTAAECRYLCECGSIAGSLLVGFMTWALSFQQSTLLLLTASSWALLGPLAIFNGSGPASPADDQKRHLEPLVSLRALLHGRVALVSLLAFAVCLSPTLDFFLFRQHRVGLTAAQQSLVSVMGSCGWFLGTSFYRHFSRGRPVNEFLQLCLCAWPVGALAGILVAALASPTRLGFWMVCLEKVVAEFCKALTFMPCTVLMQMFSPCGCASTAFTLMQSCGTVGQVLSRNLEYSFMHWCGVEPQLGSAGFEGFTHVAAVTAAWRVSTSALLGLCVAPHLHFVKDSHLVRRRPAKE